jgi:hypothetical protein
MLSACILLSALVESFAKFKRKVRVVFNKIVSSVRFSTPFFLFQLRFALMIPGSALKIAIIVGGIPAERLKTVLCDSLEILSRV